MIILCAVDERWNIGYQGDLLCKISADLKRFKKLTIGNIMIMGRKTFESLPGGKALPGRINIVLTKNKNYVRDDIIVVNSLEELLICLNKINPNNELTNYVIGGGEIVRQLLPYCSEAYLTKILKTFTEADTNIPNLDLESGWLVTEETDLFTENGLTYKYTTYKQE
ncbi:MAG TPA: dihydrofolate reductase [Epulopiscium sp.]|nr:dihydrofolate reductase [Candidatus Epulonipiscium sp.]